MIKQLTAKIDGRQMEDDFEIIEAILDSRNIEDVGSFLRPTEEDLVPFEQLKGVEEAAQVIIDAIDNDETFIQEWSSLVKNFPVVFKETFWSKAVSYTHLTLPTKA